MRKHLIGTILVLAALAACNKEVDTPTPVIDNGQEEVTSGKVTLTFKAAIDEGTRTLYTENKTASWEENDAISVCLTDGENYAVVDFTTQDGTIFSAEVESGYTPVSAVYPADENHGFSSGNVSSVHLPASYSLGAADDPGRFIPLIGSYDNEKEEMTFHHFCSALKVTLTNIPTDATVFTFAANGQQIAGDLALVEGRMGLADGTSNTSVQFAFDSGLTERSFYIPVPDGALAADSFVTVGNADEDLFKKRITSSPTFGLNTNNKDAIRVLPAVACWTRNEDWNAFYYGSYKTTSETIYKRICLENMTGSYNYEVLTGTTFNDTYGGSVANYLSSAHFDEYVSGLTQSYSAETRNLNYSNLSKGTKYVIVFGLDTNLKFTGEYNCIKVVNPTFSTPDGWSIYVVENDNYPVKFTVPSGTTWQNVRVSASDFANFFAGDVEFVVYYYARDYKGKHDADPTKYAPRTATELSITSPESGGEYVYVSFGIDDDYRATGEYCKLEYTFEAPSETYSAWIGKWSLTNGDTWTITRKQNNHTYNVKGLCGTSSLTVEAELTEDGHLLFKTQKNVGKQTYNGFDVTVNLYKRKTSSGGFYSNIGNLMQATMDEEGQTATLAPTNADYPIYSMVGNYQDANDETKYVGYGSNRSAANVTMTRVTE